MDRRRPRRSRSPRCHPPRVAADHPSGPHRTTSHPCRAALWRCRGQAHPSAHAGSPCAGGSAPAPPDDRCSPPHHRPARRRSRRAGAWASRWSTCPSAARPSDHACEAHRLARSGFQPNRPGRPARQRGQAAVPGRSPSRTAASIDEAFRQNDPGPRSPPRTWLPPRLFPESAEDPAASHAPRCPPSAISGCCANSRRAARPARAAAARRMLPPARHRRSRRASPPRTRAGPSEACLHARVHPAPSRPPDS